MNLAHLRTFICVAECGSLSKAADRLRRAQPALSRHIQLLEIEIGFPLFARHSRGMSLTPRGKELANRLGSLVSQMESTIEEVRSASPTHRGKVAFGLMPSVSYVLSDRIARRTAQQLPNVSLRIVEGYAGHLVEWLQRGEINATLLYGPACDLHVRTHDLLHEDLFLIAPADGTQPFGDTISFKQLSNLKLILPSKPHGLRAVVDQAAEKTGVGLDIGFEADSFPTLKKMVSAGLGYTILPRSAVMGSSDNHGTFKIISIRAPRLTRQVILALPPAPTLTSATQAFIETVLLDEIASMVDCGAWAAFPSAHLRSSRKQA